MATLPSAVTAAATAAPLHDADTGPTAATNNLTGVTKPATSNDDSLLASFQGVDKGVLLRMTYVLVTLTLLIILYFGIKMWRMKKRGPVRHYDVLSAKQLQPDLVVNSESEDEIYDDSNVRLMTTPKEDH